MLNLSEAEMDWIIEYLEINTGLDISDYIFCPDTVGLDEDAFL